MKKLVNILFFILSYLLITSHLYAASSASCVLKALESMKVEEGVVVAISNKAEVVKPFNMNFISVRPGISKAKTTIELNNKEIELIVEERDLTNLSYIIIAKGVDSNDIYAASKITVGGYDSKQFGLIFKTPRKLFKKSSETFEFSCNLFY